MNETNTAMMSLPAPSKHASKACTRALLTLPWGQAQERPLPYGPTSSHVGWETSCTPIEANLHSREYLYIPLVVFNVRKVFSSSQQAESLMLNLTLLLLCASKPTSYSTMLFIPPFRSYCCLLLVESRASEMFCKKT